MTWWGHRATTMAPKENHGEMAPCVDFVPIGDGDGSMFFLPSGYVKIAIENGHRNSGFSHQKW